MKSTTKIKTPAAASYIGKLCRHFVHKIEASYTETTGKAVFPAGTCHMHAEESLLVFSIEADTWEGLEKIKGVLERHLVKFAYREPLAIAWQDDE